MTTDTPIFSDGSLTLSRRTMLATSAATLAFPFAAPARGQESVAAADQMSARLAALGVPHSRRDGAAKVTGRARFAAEYTFENMTYGALAFSTIARGRIAEIDTEAAEAAPGVVLVMTHLNAPEMAPPEAFLSSYTGSAGSSLPVMQDDIVHWNGQPVAIVLAETQEQADHAAELIEVTYEEEPSVTSYAEATRTTEIASDFGDEMRFSNGDAEAALAASPVKVDVSFGTPAHYHNQMEPHAVTVAWQDDGTLRMHDCTQAVDLNAATIGKVFGIDPAMVHVTAPFVGGGFGGKTLWQYHLLAAAASRIAERPVRMNVTREGVFRICGGRAPTQQRVALGADTDGRLRALIHSGTTVKIADNAMTEGFIEGTRHLYGSETMLLEVRVGLMDMLANTFMRAPGSAVGTYALEVAMDELAEQLGIDPVDLRIRNEPEADPTSGAPFAQRALIQACEEGARRFGWQKRSGERMARREGDWLIGTGMATAYYPYQRFPGSAARITLNREGRAVVSVAAHEMGMGTTTATAAVAAQWLGVAFEDVEVRYGDNELPGSILAGGSQQTAAIGAAIVAAQSALLDRLGEIAPSGSPFAGQSSETMVVADRGVALAERPDQHMTYADLLASANMDEVTVEAEASEPTELEEFSMHSYGAVFVEARVNEVTGEVRVSKVTGVYDCGKIINAKTAASQFRGGIIMSLGMALMEESKFDERKGRVMNPSLADYHIPTHLDVPDIDVAWTDIPDPQAPTGSRGIGEISMTGAAAALANAIYDATGRRLRELPITPDKLL